MITSLKENTRKNKHISSKKEIKPHFVRFQFKQIMGNFPLLFFFFFFSLKGIVPVFGLIFSPGLARFHFSPCVLPFLCNRNYSECHFLYLLHQREKNSLYSPVWNSGLAPAMMIFTAPVIPTIFVCSHLPVFPVTLLRPPSSTLSPFKY